MAGVQSQQKISPNAITIDTNELGTCGRGFIKMKHRLYLDFHIILNEISVCTSTACVWWAGGGLVKSVSVHLLICRDV